MPLKIARFNIKRVSLSDIFGTILPIMLISAIGFYIAYQFVEPAPPTELSISTGGQRSVYDTYARQYAEFFKANGITLTLVPSDSNQENLDRLKRGEVDVGFVQGGMENPVVFDGENEVISDLRSLGSVAYEPVWVFYRGELSIDRLYQLTPKRIGILARQDNVKGIATKLLEANDIAAKEMYATDAASLLTQMKAGHLDALFLVASPEGELVARLLKTPNLKLLSFAQADAYLRRFPFLSKIVLPQGAVDLVREIPPKDTTLLATTSNVIVSGKLHPALINLLLQAMQKTHGEQGFFHKRSEFPAYKDRHFPISEEAERFYQSGPPLLQRYMPFWVAVLVDRLMVLIVPILILFLPLLRFAPSIYSFRVRSKIFRVYGDLKRLENEIKETDTADQKEAYLARLAEIEEAALARTIPLAFTDSLYILREHIQMVRNKLDETPHTNSN